MLALNEPTSWSSVDLPLIEVDDEQLNPDFEDELVGLLCRLESLRELMVAARPARQPSATIRYAAEFLGLLSAFADRTCTFSTERELDEAKRRAKDFALISAALVEQASPIFPGRTTGATVPNGPPPTLDVAAIRRCFEALNDSAFNYFIVFTNRFRTSQSARSWVDVAATFLVDLKHFTRNPIADA